MKLSEKIIELRKANEMTQEDLASKCNVSRQSISKWEADITLPEIEKLLILGNLFSVSMDVLLRDELTLSEVKEIHDCGNNIIQAKKQNIYESRNIKVFDLHTCMDLDELRQYDVVYLCGGSTSYLLERINATGFRTILTDYIHANGMVIGVSAGSLIFANNLDGNLGLIDTRLDVHCPDGEVRGKAAYPLKDHIRLTNTCALAIREIPNELEIVGR